MQQDAVTTSNPASVAASATPSPKPWLQARFLHDEFTSHNISLRHFDKPEESDKRSGERVILLETDGAALSMREVVHIYYTLKRWVPKGRVVTAYDTAFDNAVSAPDQLVWEMIPHLAPEKKVYLGVKVTTDDGGALFKMERLHTIKQISTRVVCERMCESKEENVSYFHVVLQTRACALRLERFLRMMDQLSAGEAQGSGKTAVDDDNRPFAVLFPPDKKCSVLASKPVFPAQFRSIFNPPDHITEHINVRLLKMNPSVYCMSTDCMDPATADWVRQQERHLMAEKLYDVPLVYGPVIVYYE